MVNRRVTSAGSFGISPWIGWGISTLLLLFLNRGESDSSSVSSEQQPSKFTESNVNSVGNPVPVVLGRAMIKNPIVSFYGGFRADPYTEEYGMHSSLDAASVLWPFLLNIVAALVIPSTHPVVTTSGTGVATDSQNSVKFSMLVMSILNLLIALLLALFNDNAGRTTIQKGFKYYIGWQNIICWTGENVGIKKVWMNVYDGNVEESTEIGVWDNNSHIAWKQENPLGISAHIHNEEMFGGVDEGGGFIGDIRFYFGNRVQGKDAWMVNQMTSSQTIIEELRGLTPKYPMYLTCVVSDRDMVNGAYIGKQATIPEMWFEVVNYSNSLRNVSGEYRQAKFDGILYNLNNKLTSFMLYASTPVVEFMRPLTNRIHNSIENYRSSHNPWFLTELESAVTEANNVFPQENRDSFLSITVPLLNMARRGVWTLGRLGDDLNPAEAIYEILTNDYWGCNYTNDRIDIESLVDLGCTCEEEYLGISCLINRVEKANDYIIKILNHINGVKYDNPITGKLTFKLIRSDYDVDTIKKFDVSNCESCEYSRLDWSETVSSVAVNFTDASNKYDTGQFSETDISNRMITGFYTEKQVDGEYFTTESNARWLAQSSLLTGGYPLAAVNLITNRIAFDTRIGDAINVIWEPYGISNMVFRVTDIDYANLNDGRISITAIEDVFGFDKLDFDFNGTIRWTDPERNPYDVYKYEFFEFPYEMTLSLATFVNAFAFQPSSYTVYWDIWRYVNGEYLITAKSSTWSMAGRMEYGLSESYDFDSVGFEISPVGISSARDIDEKIQKINKYPNTYNHKSNLNLIMSDGEIMSYDTIIKLPNGNYQVKGVVRGVFDTLPRYHDYNSVCYLLDYSLNITGSDPVCEAGEVKSEQVEIKTETIYVQQEFELDDIENFTTERRSERPSIMANLKFSADKGSKTEYKYNAQASVAYSGNILFSFIARNKFNNHEILEQTDTNTVVKLTENIKNVLNVYCNEVEYEYMYDSVNNDVNVSSMIMKWSDFCRELNNRLSMINDVTVNVKTYNTEKELYSYSVYIKKFKYHIPRMVGILEDNSYVQQYANSIVKPELNSVVIPETIVSPELTLTFEDCPLIFIGSKDSSGIVGQDGSPYNVTTEAYRIDGYDDAGHAITHRIVIDEEFVFRTDFTKFMDNYSLFYKYRIGNWIDFIPYDYHY